jgi:RNA polymerase sigma-70 factor (ECF subfamily)
MDLNEDYLLDQVEAGNAEAMNVLINKYKSFAFTLTLRVLNDRFEAEEAAHDAFLKAFRAIKNFNRQSSFKTWFYRIVSNTAIGYLRKRKNKEGSLSEFNDPGYTENTMENSDQNRIVHQAISRLKPNDQVILHWYYMCEMNLEEVSEIVDMNREVVKVRLFRARKKLENILINEMKIGKAEIL